MTATTTMLINATRDDEWRVALVQGGVLFNMDVEQAGTKRKKGNIYLGIIRSIEPSLGAAFIEYGPNRHGFLPLKEISPEYFNSQDPNNLVNPQIQDVLQVGQKLLVQVEKEERGTKGAALSTFISLAGSYLVLMPNNPRAGGISRRIEGDERNELREILSALNLPENMGVIIRTAGVGKSVEELQWDLSALLVHWEAIKAAAQEHPAPCLIHQESNVLIRAIRDYLRQDVEEIVIDNMEVFEKTKEYLQQTRPDFIDRLKLYTDNTPLFVRYQIENQVESIYQREVRLPSGGAIVIDQTEALVSIDINSARATRASNIEETALNTNLEATEEIARQLRLRDIGGLIVIDFIDMTRTNNQERVEESIRAALQIDRARIQVGRISRFGLLEMSRQRLRSSFEQANQVTCPQCFGRGSIRSVESFAMSIIRLVEEQAITLDTGRIELQAPIDVATYLLNEQRQAISSIEERQAVTIIIVPNPHLQSPKYKIRALKAEEGGSNLSTKFSKSYNIIEGFELETTKSQSKEQRANEAQQTPVLSAIAPPPAPKRAEHGFVKKLLAKVFSSHTIGHTEEPQKNKATSYDREASKNSTRQSNATRHTSSSSHTSGSGVNTRARPYRQKRPISSTAATTGTSSTTADNRNRARRGTRGSGTMHGSGRRHPVASPADHLGATHHHHAPPPHTDDSGSH